MHASETGAFTRISYGSLSGERSLVLIPSLIGSDGLLPYSIKKGNFSIKLFRVLYPSWVREWAFIRNSLGMESRPSTEVEDLG